MYLADSAVFVRANQVFRKGSAATAPTNCRKKVSLCRLVHKKHPSMHAICLQCSVAAVGWLGACLVW